MAGLVEMVVDSVRVHVLTNRHVVILKDAAGERFLPIWIGAWEAGAIAMKLQGVTPERPLTHDLFATTLAALGARVVRIVVTSLEDETYHARIELGSAFDGTVEVDARPSDALALAVRTEAPIYADEEVLAAAALPGDLEPEGEPGDEATRPRGARPRPVESVGGDAGDPRLDLFRDFINSLDADQGEGGRRG
jgi:bifunctional DNase/RNase